MSAAANNSNCTIEKLLEYKDAPYLKDAPIELIDLLKERCKNCRSIITDKLDYKPKEPSLYIQRKRENEDRNVTRFIHSIRGLTDKQRELLFEKANKLRYEYGTEMMPEIKALLNTFKLPNNDNNK
jgi:hypothetical protein